MKKNWLLMILFAVSVIQLGECHASWDRLGRSVLCTAVYTVGTCHIVKHGLCMTRTLIAIVQDNKTVKTTALLRAFDPVFGGKTDFPSSGSIFTNISNITLWSVIMMNMRNNSSKTHEQVK